VITAGEARESASYWAEEAAGYLNEARTTVGSRADLPDVNMELADVAANVARAFAALAAVAGEES
jgi:NTP pyrophosphatase (non-canonical NTP hydrolase)